MRKIKYIIILLLFVSSLFLYNYRIHYNEKHIYEINDLQISDKLYVDKGHILLAHNIFGFSEGIIYPNEEGKHLINEEVKSSIEYIYIKFNNKWFNENLKHHLDETVTNNIILEKYKEIHKENFKSHVHIKDFHGDIFCIVKFKDKDDLIIIK